MRARAPRRASARRWQCAGLSAPGSTPRQLFASDRVVIMRQAKKRSRRGRRSYEPGYRLPGPQILLPRRVIPESPVEWRKSPVSGNPTNALCLVLTSPPMSPTIRCRHCSSGKWPVHHPNGLFALSQVVFAITFDSACRRSGEMRDAIAAIDLKPDRRDL